MYTLYFSKQDQDDEFTILCHKQDMIPCIGDTVYNYGKKYKIVNRRFCVNTIGEFDRIEYRIEEI